MTSHTHTTADVLVIGGGSAGLSAALMLGRARRRVVVLDNGTPRNAPASHMHGVLGRDHTSPLDYLKNGRADLERYDVTVVDATVDTLSGSVGDFTATTDDGRHFTARRLVVTTGMTDVLPEIEGLAERWGRDVVQCPYCDGWEIQDRRIGVLHTGPFSVHHARMWRQWTDTLTYVTNGNALTDEDREMLVARRVEIVETPVDHVVREQDRLSGLALEDGTSVELDALAVATTFTARSALLDPLGLVTVAHPTGFGDIVEADAMGATSVPGVWVAGNLNNPQHTVIAATAAGAFVGAAVNAHLIDEETESAVQRRRHPTVLDGAFWDELYRGAEQRWSGNPNASLVSEVEHLKPGRALDVGAGEGADARWLAEHGWTVTAVDISAVAIERARATHPDVAWEQRDLLVDPFPTASFDLVSMHYFGILRSAGPEALASLVDAVAPGGTLLVVGHTPVPGHDWAGFAPTDFVSPHAIALSLDANEWTVHTDETRPRVSPTSGSGVGHHSDDVLIAVRRRL